MRNSVRALSLLCLLWAHSCAAAESRLHFAFQMQSVPEIDPPPVAKNLSATLPASAP